jgi:hypothetical protein
VSGSKITFAVKHKASSMLKIILYVLMQVLCVVCCSVGAASAAAEPSVDVRPDAGENRLEISCLGS